MKVGYKGVFITWTCFPDDRFGLYLHGGNELFAVGSCPVKQASVLSHVVRCCISLRCKKFLLHYGYTECSSQNSYIAQVIQCYDNMSSNI